MFGDALSHPALAPFLSSGKPQGPERFACHLFVMGAADYMCAARRELSTAMLSAELRPTLAVLGTNAEKADAFAARINEYRSERRYAEMLSAGASAVAAWRANPDSIGPRLAQALKQWQRSEVQVPSTGMVAIMFTDMVSSVETTQSLGDEGAMRLVQAHNLIVNAALKRRNGRQVKHTGDGIMAVFPKVPDAVGAAIDIQADIDQHNRVTPTHPLSVRIGIAAGQPIIDENDYFGTVVQLAARVCAQAGASQVLVSGGVIEASTGAGLPFGPIEHRKLKGFNDAQPLAEVILRRDTEMAG